VLSTQKQTLIVAGVLIAFIGGAFAAIVLTQKPAATAAPVTHLVTQVASTTQNTLTVVGVGTGTATPDRATLSLGVQASRTNVHDAVAAAGVDMAHLLGALHSQGVQDKDIQTATVSIYAQTNCCPQTTTSYVASNLVTVTVRLASASAVVVSAVDAVGNDLQLNGATLSVADNTAQVKAARSAAMSDANARAQEWARLSNRHVGSVIAISEIIAVQPGNICDGCGKGGGGGAAVQFLPGQSTMTITITVIYDLA
jgi:uncharacterized protein YggE